MRTIKAVLLVLIASGVMPSFAAISWKTSVYSGSFTNGANWSGGVVPASGDQVVSSLSSGDYVITFPAGDYVPCLNELQFLLTGAGSITFDGRGGTFAMPGTNSWSYGGVPFSFRQQTSGGVIWDFEDWTSYKSSLVWTNAHFKLSRDNNTITLSRVDFDYYGGTFDARGFNATNGKGVFAVPAAKAYRFRFLGGEFKFGAIMNFGCNATEGALYEVNGGTFYSYGIRFPSDTKNIGTYAITNTIRVTGTGSVFTTTGSTTLGDRFTTKDNVLMLEASNGGTFEFGLLKPENPATVFYNIHDGGILQFNGGNSSTPIWSNAADADTVVRIADATLNFFCWAYYGKANAGAIDFKAERSRITSNAGEYFASGDYFIKDCVYTNTSAGGAVYIGTVNGATSRMALSGSDLVAKGNFYVGNNGGTGVFTATGGVIRCGTFFQSYDTASSSGTLTLSGGAKMYASSTVGFGVRGSGSVRVEDGAEFNSTVASDGANFHVGFYSGSTGSLTVDGGTVNVLRDATVGNEGTGTLTVESGTFSARSLSVGGAAGGHGTVVLNDGTLAGSIMGGSGTSAFTANGGTNVAVSAATQISGLGSAKLGAKGLTVSTAAYDVAMPQDFSNLDDAPGVLVKIGSGKLTISSTGSTHAKTVAKAGTLAFSGVSAYAPTVEVEDGAVLQLPANMGGITLGGLKLGTRSIALSGNSGTDGSYDVLTVTGDIGDATKTAWENSFVKSGGTEGKGYRFSVSTSGGTTTFTVVVATRAVPSGSATWSGPGENWADDANWTGTKPATVATAVFAGAMPTAVTIVGTETVGGLAVTSGSYTFSGSGKLAFDPLTIPLIAVSAGDQTVNVKTTIPKDTAVTVSSGASLAFAGGIENGGLAKSGGGALTLSGIVGLPCGFGLNGGLLSLSDVSALDGEMANSTFEAGTLALGNAGAGTATLPCKLTLNTAAEDTAVAIRADGDVAMAVPTVNKGLIVKYGPGSLAFDAAASVTLSKNGGALPTGDPSVVARSVNAGDYAPAANAFSGLNVVEGELKLRGISKAVKYTVKPTILVGLNSLDEGLSAQPKLTVESCSVESVNTASQLELGSGIGPDCFVTDPTLYLTNSYVDVTTIHVGVNSTKAGLHPYLRAVDSTLVSRWASMLYACTGEGGGCRYEFVNSSFRTRNNIEFQKLNSNGDAILDFNNSVLEGLSASNDIDPAILNQFTVKTSAVVLKAAFKNGSNFRCVAPTIQTYQADRNHVLSFDNSYWTPSVDDANIAFRTAGHIDLRAEAGGLKFAVPASKTWTLMQPVIGAGAIVKEGAGTLYIDVAKKYDSDAQTAVEALPDPLVVTCTNGIEIVSGTVTVAEGAAPAGVRVTGGGTLSGRLTSPVFALSSTNEGFVEKRLTLTDCTFDGRVFVDFGRTEGNPLPRFANKAIMHYTGSAPDVSKWKVANIGDARWCGLFTAVDSEIRLSLVSQSGTLVGVR